MKKRKTYPLSPEGLKELAADMTRGWTRLPKWSKHKRGKVKA